MEGFKGETFEEKFSTMSIFFHFYTKEKKWFQLLNKKAGLESKKEK